MIRYAEAMGVLERQQHPLGDIMRMNAENAVLATYYRNNILHLFAHAVAARVRLRQQRAHAHRRHPAPGVARVSVHFRRTVPALGRGGGERRGGRPCSTPSCASICCRATPIAASGSVRRRHRSRRSACRLLAQATIQTIERYYLAIALLLQAGSGTITREALEERCHLMAQRMSVLYGLNSPEFFDKSLFRNFIELLRRRDVIQMSEDEKLLFGDPLLGVAADAQLVLSEQIRHSILQVTLGQ